MNTSSPRFWRILALVVLVAGVLLFALSGYLGSSLKYVSNPLIAIQEWFSTRYFVVYEFFTVPKDLASVRQRNLELESEVSNLQTQVIELQQQLREAQVLYALLDFARSRPESQYVAAAVIGRDPSPFLHYVVIDHGSDDGLRHGMPVVTDKGLVGRVDAVTAGAARVQLVSDPGYGINVRLQSAQTSALLSGSITGDINLEMVPQDVVLQSGDLILTSGLGGNYPSEVVVGQVISVRKQETSLFQSASVQPAVDFASLRAVLVVVNFNPVDISPLIPTLAP
jgi:rod shape-determining protein MreC